MCIRDSNFNYQQPTITKSYLQSQFILSFYLNLKSIYNFNDFLNKNNNYEKFYKSKNITLEKYFYKANFSDFKNKEKNNNLFVFRFIFPEDFPGNDFFKDYIEFTKNKTIVMFKSEIKETLVSAIDNDQKIIDAIKIKNNADYFVSTSFSELTMRIEQNKILNIDLISKNFDYNAFLQKPSKPAPVLRYYKLFYSLLGLSLGFFLSLIIVYVKNFKVLK